MKVCRMPPSVTDDRIFLTGALEKLFPSLLILRQGGNICFKKALNGKINKNHLHLATFNKRTNKHPGAWNIQILSGGT